MQNLRELQQYWQDYLLHHHASNLRPAIMTPVTDTIDERIAIYADAYITRLIEVLEKNYPYFKQWIGENAFYQLAKDYFAAYPSRYVTVRDVGQHFSSFIHLHPIYGQQAAYSEMAKLEWTISCTIDTPDASPLEKNTLEQIPQEKWGEVVFELHPSLFLLQFTTNIISIYQALINGNDIPPIESHVNIFCRFWRKNLQVYYLVINSAEQQFLTGLQEQRSFSEICEVLCQNMPEDQVISYTINQLLRWLEDKILISYTFKELT